MPAPIIRFARGDESALVIDIDDDATRLYATAGLELDLSPSNPFGIAERARWTLAVREGRVLLALDDRGVPAGFAALGIVDGAAYIDQLSVRLEAMRRGLGGGLVRAALDWASASGGGLWLNTYGHLPWNRPFYERLGFRLVPEPEWGPEMRAIVEGQRAAIPLPEQRIVMHHA